MKFKNKISFLLLSLYILGASAENKCGSSFANSACGNSCPLGLNSECPSGQTCWAGAPSCPNTPSSTPRCGTSYSVSGCGSTCPNGIDGQCPSGQRCWADPPPCTGTNPTPFPTTFPTDFPNNPNPTPFPTEFPPTGGTSNCNVGQTSGVCKTVGSCRGISVANYCPGSSSNQCCVLEPESSTVMHLPNEPSSSGSIGSCTSLQDGFRGICVQVTACTGATFNDVCGGSSSYKCCVAETEEVVDILKDPVLSREVDHLDLLDYNTFRSLFNGISSTRAAALYPYYNYALAEVLLDSSSRSESCYRSAGFAAQVGHESVGLKYFEEIASGIAYEGREDLGNIYPGDGPRYKGRGPIQLTGRANYQYASSRLGENLEDDPDRVCFPNMGFLTTVDYWMSRNLNRYAGTSSESDFIQLTRLINGGTNGLTDRQNRWYTARRLLGCDNLAEEVDGSVEVKEGNENFVSVMVVIFGLMSVAIGVYIVASTKKKEVTSSDTEVVGEVEENEVTVKNKKVQNPMYI